MRRLALAGLVIAALAALAAVGAGLGFRGELWSYRTAFGILRWSAYAGLGAALLSLLAAVFCLRRRPRRGLWLAAAGLLLGLVVAAVPLSHLRAARSVPPIHDISTDVDDPPAFVAILPLRAGAPNAAEYGGPAVAAEQRAAYPDIVPVTLPLPPDEAYAKALAAARSLGWTVVADSPGEGRIEATDTTFWFRFRDDIVVRVRPRAGGSVVDIRSVSRVGRSDTGTNAARIRRFIDELKS